MVTPLQGLAAVVHNYLEELRISEALEAIVSQLKAVGANFNSLVFIRSRIFLAGQYDDERD